MSVVQLPKFSAIQQADTSPTANTVALRDGSGGLTGANMQGSNLQSTGTVQYPSPPTKTSSFTIDASSVVYVCDATSGALAATLPAASASAGLIYTVIKKDNSHNVTLTGAGSDNINGANTSVISSQYGVVRVISDGTQWWII